LVKSDQTSSRPGEHVVDEALERLLGAHLDKGAHALAVERLQPLDPLHGRGDLLFEQVLDTASPSVG
jgi:hypothetical protein